VFRSAGWRIGRLPLPALLGPEAYAVRRSTGTALHLRCRDELPLRLGRLVRYRATCPGQPARPDPLTGPVHWGRRVRPMRSACTAWLLRHGRIARPPCVAGRNGTVPGGL
jgi:hypothetical protein